MFLDVSRNRLERLPPELQCLQSLTDLYLSNNMLLELLDNIGEQITMMTYVHKMLIFSIICTNFNHSLL